MQIVGGDVNAELGPGIGIERPSVGMHTLNKSDSRGDWFEQWLMLQKFVALNTTHKKHLRNKLHTGHLMLDYNHRCVTAQLVIPATKKGGLPKPIQKMDELCHGEHQKPDE